MPIVVVAMLVAGCGGSGGRSADVVDGGSTSGATDSLPAETSSTGSLGATETTAVTATGRPEAGAGSGPSPSPSTVSDAGVDPSGTVTGAGVSAARDFSDFFGQRVGLIASRASVIEGGSTIDALVAADDVDLVAIFAPEHGVRGDGAAGAEIVDGTDTVTGLPVHSLYGETRRPTAAMLDGIDVLAFDLQDVGARFYTYTSTMGLAMQAAAEAGIPFVVLDRPNPLGGRAIGGGVLDQDQSSFIGLYPVPSEHAMTAGELALAIKGEGWLDGLDDLDLRVVEVAGWSRDDLWVDTGLPWVAPSPGLPTVDSAVVYPGTVLLEATTLSYGRGTDHPFRQLGAPWLDGEALAEALTARDLPGLRFVPVRFTPRSSPSAPDPQYRDQELSGVRIDVADPALVEASRLGVHVLDAVLEQAAVADGSVEVIDRPKLLDLLTGSSVVRRRLAADDAPLEIVGRWESGLAGFEPIRERYLLY